MTMILERDDAPVSGPDEDEDDVAEDYPVPEPIDAPEDEPVPEDKVAVNEVPGWCGRVDYELVGPGGKVSFDNRDELSDFLDLVKHPGFDAFVENVRGGKYDQFIKA